jgi:hypothetical protein
MTTMARRPVRRPARRKRHYRSYHLSRWATFGAGFFAALGGWLYAVQPLHWVAAWMPWAILGAMTVAGEIVIPAVVVFILFCLPALLIGGPSRRLRINHRRRHGRAACKSAVITRGLTRVVHAMDRNRCLYCGITAWQLAQLPPRVGKDGVTRKRCLHVDHGKPWIAGFLTVLPNLGMLCDEHNEIKSCYYRERNGYVWYHGGSRTPERVAKAADITRVARQRSKNPLRLVRAAWALGA